MFLNFIYIGIKSFIEEVGKPQIFQSDKGGGLIANIIKKFLEEDLY